MRGSKSWRTARRPGSATAEAIAAKVPALEENDGPHPPDAQGVPYGAEKHQETHLPILNGAEKHQGQPRGAPRGTPAGGAGLWEDRLGRGLENLKKPDSRDFFDRASGFLVEIDDFPLFAFDICDFMENQGFPLFAFDICDFGAQKARFSRSL